MATEIYTIRIIRTYEVEVDVEVDDNFTTIVCEVRCDQPPFIGQDITLSPDEVAAAEEEAVTAKTDVPWPGEGRSQHPGQDPK